jgi:choline dehydrogenase
MEKPDYIIVGSGAGGGPLAAGLARRGFKVLLLEAGGDLCSTDTGRLMYEVPAFNAASTEFDASAWRYFVNHYDDLEQALRDTKFDDEGGGVWYPRAGALGGCTVHNAMITVTPQAIDWDFIAKLTGDWSWRAGNMNRYFARLERCRYVPRPGSLAYVFKGVLWSALALLRNRPDWKDWSHGHGFKGWLGTAEARPELLLKDAVLTRLVLGVVKLFAQRGVGSLLYRAVANFDPNDLRNAVNCPEGLALTPLSTSHGARNGPREYLLETLKRHPDRLEIRLNTLASRVIIENGAAVGVEFREGPSLYQADPRFDPNANWTSNTAFAAREVILAAGAFNSPQLLMLSGVGPRAELEKHGVEVLVDSPGVGRNLQDRYEIGVVSQYPQRFRLLKGARFRPSTKDERDPYLRTWKKGKGLYTSIGALISIVKRSSRDLPEPDLFIFALPADFRGFKRGYSERLERYKDKLTWVVLKAYTNNTAGYVTLRSADPAQRPSVHFRYFDEGSDEQNDDLDALLEGVQFVRKLNQFLGTAGGAEIVPGRGVETAEQIRSFIRDEAWGHHASCTNKIGPSSDPMAVLDSRFRVRGVERLRVVDASVFPRIPGYFIVSAVYMISEKAVDVIAEDAERLPPLD